LKRVERSDFLGRELPNVWAFRIFEEGIQRRRNLRETRNKTAIHVTQPKEGTLLRFIIGRSWFPECFRIFHGNLEFYWPGNMSQVIDGVIEEMELFQVQRQTGVLQERKYLVEVTEVVILRIGEKDYIIEIDKARLSFQSRQGDINGTLEICRDIPEAKRHPEKSESPLLARESRLVRIYRSKRNVPKAAITVLGTEYTGIPERINTHSSIRGSGYVSRIVMAFSFR
jgi:hypothetical protein